MIPVEKPGTPQELVHFGKKGMKWGVRNLRTSETNAFRSQHTTRTQRDNAIKRARVKDEAGRGTKQDAATSRRLTSGEKTVLALLAVTGIATLPIAAFTGANVAIRRHQERQLRK